MRLFLVLSILAASLILPGFGVAGELTGYVAVEARGFLNPPQYSRQKRDDASIVLAPEFYHEWENSGASFTAAPLLRLDSSDPERTHFDMRELFFLKVFTSFEASVGLRKVFWGVTESQHLVDIINQSDLVESPDGEDKFGQPMLSLSAPLDYGTFDFYLMPYFRERSFPGEKGRLRSEPYVDADRATFDSGAKEYHTDLAIRYSHSLGDWDLALSHFWGTGREPSFKKESEPDGTEVFAPFYEVINQSGLELQKVAGQWLLKAEAIHRSGQGEPFVAFATGFEYTLVGVGGGYMDLGLLGEWLYDDRGSSASTPFENDIFIGARLAVNDPADTSLLVGMIFDLDDDARFYFIESSRRVTDRVRATLEVRLQELSDDDRLKSIKDDDFIMLELAYYL